jgi:hypothetical protein
MMKVVNGNGKTATVTGQNGPVAKDVWVTSYQYDDYGRII